MASQGETVIRCMICDDFEGPIFEFVDRFGTIRVCVNCRNERNGKEDEIEL